jgi:hypothetical protein
MSATRNHSQSPRGDDGSESEYIQQDEDGDSEDMYIPQVGSTSETEISDPNVESEDAGTDNDKTPIASRTRGSRKTPIELSDSGDDVTSISSKKGEQDAASVPTDRGEAALSSDSDAPLLPLTRGKKRGLGAGLSIGKKRTRRPDPGLFPNVTRDPGTAGMDIYQGKALRLISSKHTPILNKWLAVRDTLSIKEVVALSTENLRASTTRFKPLSELPDLPGRKFTHQIKLVNLEITWDPQEGEDTQPRSRNTADELKDLERYRKHIKTWRITVCNSALPPAQQKYLRVFPEVKPVRTKTFASYEGHAKSRGKPPRPVPDKQKWVIRGGPLDISICPTEAEARKVADEICRLLAKIDIDENEFPNEVDLHFSGSSFQPSFNRALLELTALRVLRSDFDFRDFRWVFRHEYGYYSLCPSVVRSTAPKRKSGPQPLQYEIKVPIFCTNPTARFKGNWPHVQILDHTFTQESLDTLPDVPQWWGFRYNRPSRTKPGQKELLPMDSMMKLFNYMSWQLFGCVGSRDALNIAARNMVRGARESKVNSNHVGPFKGKLLFQFLPSQGIFGISPAVAETIHGTVPQFNTQLPVSALALALQSSFEVMEKSRDQLRMIEEAVVGIQELTLGKSILTAANYCKCGEDQAVRDVKMHFCMFCLRLMICSHLSWTPDGRLICLDHFKGGTPPPTTHLQRRVYEKSRHCDDELRNPLSFEHRMKIRDVLVKNYIIPEVGFEDAFDGKRSDNLQVKALAMSVDATFPIHKAEGVFYVHHFNNIRLTTEFANRLKGDDIPIVLPAASEAVATKSDGKYLDDIELAFDHYSMIRLLIPQSKERRIEAASKTDSSWWNRYRKMMVSGVYDNSAPIHQIYWRSFEDASSSWSDHDITRLAKICEEIENNPKINPKKLKLLRGRCRSSGKPDAPWLWIPTHMFQDHSWAYLNALFTSRFQTMDNRCDWANDHENESPETLFLACVVLWFLLDGGKDEILGLRMTVFRRHPLRFSIGRALCVEPGSIMRTGWKAKYVIFLYPPSSSSTNNMLRHPHSLSQYDDELRTITMESWMMNRGKWCCKYSGSFTHASSRLTAFQIGLM